MRGGVIIERARKWGGVESVVGSVLLKGVRNFPEFFEKSIDKHKIDAILNSTVRFLGQPFGAVILLDGEPGESVC